MAVEEDGGGAAPAAAESFLYVLFLLLLLLAGSGRVDLDRRTTITADDVVCHGTTIRRRGWSAQQQV
jgi:hypothetical protein